MTGVGKKDGDSEGDSGFVTPDSTTREKVQRFSVGEDVLSHDKDGIYYLGKIVEVDVENDRCCVKFEDKETHWSLFKDITKLRIPESDELCVTCKSSRCWDGNEIVFCSICDKGYHQKCLQPEISNKYCEGESHWECPKCSCDSALLKEEKKKLKESSPRKLKPRLNHVTENYLPGLPYNLDSLTWDISHKSNKEQSYCYCGGPGEWYNRMLQCQRCKQWFHEACVDCLHIPILNGDRFYVFVCSLCNGGYEFLHRFDVKWVDIVHLATFNLTLQESRMFFDYDTGITQWINDNWEILQCPLKLQNLRVSERKKVVIQILEANKSRFKCGREFRKKASLWGLRVKVPPPVPFIALPADEIITEESIKKFVLQHKNSDTPPIPRGVKLKEEKSDDSDVLCRYSPAKKRAVSPNVLLFPDEEEIEIELENQDDEANVQIERPIKKRKRKRELDILMEDKKAKKMIEDICKKALNDSVGICRNAFNDSEDICKKMFNGSDISSFQKVVVTDSKRKRGRPPKVLDIGPVKMLRQLLNIKSCESLKERVKCENGLSKLSPVEDPEGFPSIAVPRDTSGDDSSSHGTLESFIPPLSNFDGHNHPFLNLDSLSYGMPVVRPLKRKLSENDIKIGKNGEIKRRRFRRTLDKAKYAYIMLQQGNAIGGSGMRPNGLSNIQNCVDYALSGGLQLHKNNDSHSNDENGGFSMSDLKSSVNSYFGAANRIANGENFNILAKRTNNVDHNVQYLIEWETSLNS